MKRRLYPILFLALPLAAAPAQILDRVAAVVDDEIILESELKAQVQFFVLNNRVDPNTPGLREEVLEQMINEKLIIAKAIEDSITVSDDEVQQQLNAVIQQRVQQVGSEARLEELYGMPLSRIRREFRDEMRKNLLASRLQQQRFGAAQIGRREVEEFFAAFKDSLPIVPEEVELAHIFVAPKVSETARAAARVTMDALIDSLQKALADFADLAKRHSQDPGSAARGGDLGLVRRGQFVKEFETAVFALEEGQRSGIVESEFGLHIIELLERRGDAVRPRHILLRIQRTQADDDSVIAFLTALRERALAGEGFADLARQYSEDKETAAIGGRLGTEALERLDKNFYPTVAPLKEGEISPPTRLAYGASYGFHIVKVLKRTPAHPMSLELDYHRVEAIAMNYKRNKEYVQWLDELRTKIHWEIRL
jgi:peptidyl-prolyl cis-trans isomerase SurA